MTGSASFAVPVLVTIYRNSITSPARWKVVAPFCVCTFKRKTEFSKREGSGVPPRLHAERTSRRIDDKELRMSLFIHVSFFDLACGHFGTVTANLIRAPCNHSRK